LGGQLQVDMAAFLLGLIVGVYALVRRPDLDDVPCWRTLMAAFYMLLCNWAAAAVASLFAYLSRPSLAGAAHATQRACTAGAALLLALWCWRATTRKSAYGPRGSD
jgi:hypothetical protein